MIRILHFTNGGAEYIILTEDESADAADFANPGFELCGEYAAHLDKSYHSLPIERELVVGC